MTPKPITIKELDEEINNAWDNSDSDRAGALLEWKADILARHEIINENVKACSLEFIKHYPERVYEILQEMKKELGATG